MEPNFIDGEYLLTDKITYRLKEPQRGDVIVFEAPANSGEEFIKRIIAVPGENFSIKEGTVFINGRSLKEPYFSKDPKTLSGAFLKEGEEITVPQDSYLVLGDNRHHSSDSRRWGFIAKEKITGRAWLIYWPVSKAGIIEKVQYSFN